MRTLLATLTRRRKRRLTLLILCTAYIIVAALWIAFPARAHAVDYPKVRKGCHTQWCQKVRATVKISKRIDRTLAQYGSPFAGTGLDFARAGRHWNINPFLPVAATGIESTFGRAACGINPWGWASCQTSPPWATWREGIHYVTRYLRQRYVNEWGLTDVWAIGRVYCPPCGDGWGNKAAYYMRYFWGSGPGITYKAALKAVK